MNQPSPWENLKAHCILGSSSFIGAMKHSLTKKQQTAEIPKQQRLAFRPALNKLIPKGETISKTERNKAIQEAFLTHRYTQSEISRQLGLHYSTISRLINDKMSK